MSNNIIIRGATIPLRAAITKALTIDNPEWLERKAKRRPTWGIEAKLALWVPQGTDIITPRGFLTELQAILTAQGIAPEKVINYQYTIPRAVDFGLWNPDIPPYDHQLPAIEAYVKGNGVVVAPAGAGKTLIGMRGIYEIGVPALWLAHTIDLIKQAADDARTYMPGVGRVGMFADGVADWGDGKLFVATAQTLKDNTKLIEALNNLVGLVNVDEGHHFPAALFNEVVSQFSAPHLKALTATPDRKDRMERVMYLGIGPKLAEIPRDTLYEKGFLIKPKIEFVYTEFCYEQASDRTEINSVDAGGDDLDYAALIRTLCEDEARLELVARQIIDAIPGNCQLVLSDNIRYLYCIKAKVAEIWKREMIAFPPHEAVVHGSLQRYAWYVARNEKDAQRRVTMGYALDYRYNKGLKRWEVKQEQYTADEYLDWQISPKERANRIEALRQRKLQIVYATAQLVQEGLNIPHLTVGHLATPKRGDGREKGRRDGSAVEQAIGRLQRRDPKNPNKVAIWYDYVDYNVGVLKDQYYSRRKVYQRLGLSVPKKKAEATHEQLDYWLGTMPY